MDHPVPIEGQITGIGFALVIGGFISPDGVFLELITYPHGVVGRLALIGSITVVTAAFHQVQAGIFAGEIIDRGVVGSR
jgi:hypothetical protein